jgi:hypothetical protein
MTQLVSWQPRARRRSACLVASMGQRHGSRRPAGQRHRIGLSGRAGIQVVAPIQVRPVVALDRRAAQSAKDKLAAVRVHLASAGLPTDLDGRQVNLVGRLDPT